MDFDGIIKGANNIKSDVFEELFCNYGVEFLQRLREYHVENGEISRYKKIVIDRVVQSE